MVLKKDNFNIKENDNNLLNSSKNFDNENNIKSLYGNEIETNDRLEMQNFDKNKINIRNSIIGYQVKMKDRKTTQRIKKLGNNVYDFII